MPESCHQWQNLKRKLLRHLLPGDASARDKPAVVTQVILQVAISDTYPEMSTWRTNQSCKGVCTHCMKYRVKSMNFPSTLQALSCRFLVVGQCVAVLEPWRSISLTRLGHQLKAESSQDEASHAVQALLGVCGAERGGAGVAGAVAL